MREFTLLPDLRKGSRACARDGKETEKGPGKWSVKGAHFPARTFILNGFSVGGRFGCRFIEGVSSRATFLNVFFVFRVLIWQEVFVIYRFRPLWLSRCVSGEGLVRSRWLALVAVAVAPSSYI